MVDKSAAEQAAVAAAFPGCRVLLCDFHRLQAQWRWLTSNKSGVKGDGPQRQVGCHGHAALLSAPHMPNQLCPTCCPHNHLSSDQVFRMLREIGNAANQKQLDTSIFTLTKSPLFTGNKALQRYWREHWENCQNLWVTYYRQVC
jgi:hypothetical protein